MEPAFQYRQLRPELGRHRIASAGASGRVVVLGTDQGYVHVLGVQGEEIRLFRHHMERVTQVAVNAASTHVVSCSLDGMVVVVSLWDVEKHVMQFDGPLDRLLLHPRYPAGTHHICLQGPALPMSLYTTANQHPRRIPQGSHPRAWSEKGVLLYGDTQLHAYDTRRSKHVGSLEPPLQGIKLLSCVFTGVSDAVIGWSTAVDVITTAGALVRTRRLELHPGPLQGVGTLHDNIVVLGASSKRAPQLLTLSRHGHIVDQAALPMDDVLETDVDEYRLVSFNPDLVLVTSRSRVITLRPRTADDHILYLLAAKRFREAIREMDRLESECVLVSRSMVLIQAINDALDADRYTEAAELCALLCASSAWEPWVFVFGSAQRAHYIAPHLRPPLSPAAFGCVVKDLLLHDHTLLLDTLRRWDVESYDAESVIVAIREELLASRSRPLSVALAEVYLVLGRQSEALDILLSIRDERAFDIVLQLPHNHIQHRVRDLFALDTVRSLRLLDENPDLVPIATVVSQLEHDARLLHAYLEHLDATDSAPYHQRLLRLHMQLRPEAVLPLLQTSPHIDMGEAMPLCEEHGLYREAVYILLRMGDVEKALDRLLGELGDTKQAIAFVHERHDPKLWDDLVRRSADNEQLLRDLLTFAATHEVGMLHPRALLEHLRADSTLTDVTEQIRALFYNYGLELHLNETTRTILLNDIVALLQQMHGNVSQPQTVDPLDQCPLCSSPISVPDKDAVRKEITVFHCGHRFHHSCMEQAQNTTSCKLCDVSHRVYLKSKQGDVSQTSAFLGGDCAAELSPNR